MWGKIIGAMAGFAMGGPFGAVMGAAFGHAAEEGIAGKGNPFGGTPFGANFGGGFGAFPGFGTGFTAMPGFMPGGREQVFALAVVVLAAKIAKVDGPVKRTEIDAFKRAFHIPPEAVRDVGQLFDRARDSQEDPLAYATRLGQAFADAPGTLEDVLTALFSIAASDGPINTAERDLLSGIAKGFGLDRVAWERASGQRARRNTGYETVDEDPYAVLGLKPGAPVAEARAAWMRLVRENHPDALASRGLSADLVAKASDKVARINAAWDRIKRERAA